MRNQSSEWNVGIDFESRSPVKYFPNYAKKISEYISQNKELNLRNVKDIVNEEVAKEIEKNILSGLNRFWKEIDEEVNNKNIPDIKSKFNQQFSNSLSEFKDKMRLLEFSKKDNFLQELRETSNKNQIYHV